MQIADASQAEKDWVNAAKEHEIRYTYRLPDSFKLYKVIKDRRTGEVLYDSRRKKWQTNG